MTFPLTALDMAPYVHEEARALMEGAMLYDLFAVTNHLGGMTGGHYTSCVRAVPCTSDGVEEVASSFPCEDTGESYQLATGVSFFFVLNGARGGPDARRRRAARRWLHVDDDVVEEAGPNQVVTDAAYVLFYRRRRLTPATVINLTT